LFLAFDKLFFLGKIRCALAILLWVYMCFVYLQFI
jgi:hypothetical protein